MAHMVQGVTVFAVGVFMFPMAAPIYDTLTQLSVRFIQHWGI
jgi:hypothetical protein